MVLRPGGFPEYSPAQQLIFDDIVKIIEKHYQQFGYTHIHTPAVESNAVLLSKNGEETGKQIFGLYWLEPMQNIKTYFKRDNKDIFDYKSNPNKSQKIILDDGRIQGLQTFYEAFNESALKDYSLHFDLTVPFARYVLDWEHELTFPFKRYQIQPVRRGERAQKWRYREFRQCDVDAIRKDDSRWWKQKISEDTSSYIYYDAEVILDLYKAIAEIAQYASIDDTPIFHVNNKKIINWLLLTLFKTPELKHQVSTLIDKYTKIWQDKFILSLKDLWIKDKEISKLLEFLHLEIRHEKDLMNLVGFVKNDEFTQWLEELIAVMKYLDMFKETMGWIDYKIDFKIVRWLDYYTWTVFECYFQNDAALWSICGGGRYDNLTGYIDPKKKDYSWVWWSIGISRILGKIFEHETSITEQKTISEYLFVHFPETIQDILMLAWIFIKEGKNIEIYPCAEKLGKQFAYADKKWIPHVVIFGEGEKALKIYKIKNMKTGEEKEVRL